MRETSLRSASARTEPGVGVADLDAVAGPGVLLRSRRRMVEGRTGWGSEFPLLGVISQVRPASAMFLGSWPRDCT